MIMSFSKISTAGWAFIFVLSVVLLPATHTCWGGEPAFKVTFIAVSEPEEEFWNNIISMAQAAADDLNIELEVLSANRNHVKAVELARTVCAREVKPDYLIVVGEKNIGGRSLALAEEAGIPAMLFGDLTQKERKKYGSPRQRFKNWIGQRKINDYGMGKETALAIINKARATGLAEDDGTLNVLGLGGVFATSFSDERVRGLRDAVKEDNKVRLLQVVSTDWTMGNGYNKAWGLLQRYTQQYGYKIGAVWAANSQIALGAIKAGKDMNLIAGKDFFTSGIDWEPEAYETVQQGKMLSISGGHFAEVAWMMVMLYDYHHGIDFINDKSIGTSFQLDKENLGRYLRIFNSSDWQQIDFSTFSKVRNKKLKKYHFSFEAILKQFHQDVALPAQ